MLEALPGRTFAPERNPFEAEVETFFLGRPAEGGFGLPGEGGVEPVFGDDAAGEALAVFDLGAGGGVHEKGQCITSESRYASLIASQNARL